MKHFILLAFLILFASFMSSCNFIKGRRAYYIGVDTLLNAKNEKLKTYANDTAQIKNTVPVTTAVVAEQKQTTGFGYGNDKYYMIVGSFLNQELAERYAERIQQMGYHTQIIQSSNSYYRVSAESFTNYKEGVNQISEFREKIAVKAWLHVRK
jgi:cell division protein FtsN